MERKKGTRKMKKKNLNSIFNAQSEERAIRENSLKNGENPEELKTLYTIYEETFELKGRVAPSECVDRVFEQEFDGKKIALFDSLEKAKEELKKHHSYVRYQHGTVGTLTEFHTCYIDISEYAWDDDECGYEFVNGSDFYFADFEEAESND